MMNLMKKTAIGAMGISLFSLCGMVSADFPSAREGISLGYWEEQQPYVTEITNKMIKFTSPILTDAGDDKYVRYLFYYSPNLLLKENESDAQRIVLPRITDANDTKFDFEFPGTEEGIDLTQDYYGYFVPIDSFDLAGTESKMFCFNLERGEYKEGDDCYTFKKEPDPEPVEQEEIISHNSSSVVDMSMANISHTLDGNVVTFRWTALEGSDKVDIFSITDTSNGKHKVGSPKMTDELFSYTLPEEWEYVFEFRPSDGGKEIRYTINYKKPEDKEKKVEKVTIKTPTGPAETIFVVLALSVIGYLAYRKFAKN